MLEEKINRQEIYFRRPEKTCLERPDHDLDVFPWIGASHDMEFESRWRLSFFDVST